jgi:ABC-2 type transport system ATP-binding protein
MITVEHLTKSFSGRTVVDDLSFSIEPGEIIGLLGPNGAGKTTTMRMMTGFLAPDKGDVKISGRSIVHETTAAQALLGYLPENNPLYRDMLVSDFLSLTAALVHLPPETKRSAFDFVVDRVGIGEVFYQPVRTLSKGFRQRVGLAAALLHRPPLIILDEPTEGLDPNQRAEIRELIKALAIDRTIIMSTHVMQEASAICNRLLIINHGKLIANGTTSELSHLGQSTRTLTVEVEGKDIEPTLRKLPHVAELDLTHIHGQRYRATLTIDTDAELQPEISKLVREHAWTIWTLAEEERALEDTFQQLTNEDV